ncbi:PREDICTED: vesicle-associated membrane protein 2-like, partial [Haliaeetus leucocephalus]
MGERDPKNKGRDAKNREPSAAKLKREDWWRNLKVVDIMRVNVDKVLERDQKLSELDDRADALQAGASQFETSAAKLKRKYWWKNLKMMIILGVICAIVLIIIIGECCMLMRG